MKLYHLILDGKSFWVEAPSLAAAIEAWQRHYFEEEEEPEDPDIVTVYYGSVIRSGGEACAQAAAQPEPVNRLLLEAIHKAIEDEVTGYRLSRWFVRDGTDHLPLVDRLTPEGDETIAAGQEEVAGLVDAIQGAVDDAIRAADEQGEKGDNSVGAVADRMQPKPSSHPVNHALRAAAEAFGGDDDDAARAARDKAARYARAYDLLEKWSRENVDFDARVTPVIERFLGDIDRVSAGEAHPDRHAVEVALDKELLRAAHAALSHRKGDTTFRIQVCERLVRRLGINPQPPAQVGT